MKSGRFNRSVLNLIILLMVSIACQNSSSKTSGLSTSNTQAEPASSPSRLTPSATDAPPALSHTAELIIQITEIPSKGAGRDALETIVGRVSGVKAAECRVVVFARTNTWYVQPYIDSSDTSISEDGTWRTDTHLGNRYAALLVKNSYKPPTTTGKLPAVGREVLAVATADAKE